MTGFSVFPALLPGFIHEWSLTNTQAGWINGILYGGYLVSVPVLVSLTDRLPPKRIYFLSMALSGIACLGFALFAEGLWTGLLFRALIGIGLAGTYMPGLKIISDHIEGPIQSRAIAFYTASFSIGAALSFLMAGEISSLYNWQWASIVAAGGPLLAMMLVSPVLPRELPADHEEPDTHLLDFRPVLKCRAAMGYVLAYTAHNFELFNLRSWMVAYLVFAQGLVEPGYEMWSATAAATFVTLLGLPSSVIGNEFSNRFGRNRVITVVMLSSAVLSAVIGFLAGNVPYWLIIGFFIVYGITVTADSASITSGVVAAAPKGYRGATMAVHSCIGFSGAFLGPLVFGVMLDVGASTTFVSPWGLAFVVTGLAVAMGPVALRLFRADPNLK
ncbi:MAG: MFS transporter [Rhodospirillaceae bacterium]|nr:MFS transporter [Rhodospirillaceae bacterium]MBL6941665.1 MFS transporter [Rhodospirillales bacterium]